MIPFCIGMPVQLDDTKPVCLIKEFNADGNIIIEHPQDKRSLTISTTITISYDKIDRLTPVDGIPWMEPVLGETPLCHWGLKDIEQP